MPIKHKLIAFFGILALLFGAADFSHAAPKGGQKDDLQRRFKERLRDIQALKADGKIGETWEGYLEPVKGKLPDDDRRLVAEENDDRQDLYQSIAAEEKTSPKVVAERNASRAYRNGKRGEYFKLKNGDWRQKEDKRK